MSLSAIKNSQLKTPNSQPKEARTRYFIRNQGTKRGWKVQHPKKGDDCLEEQEVQNYLPELGLGRNRPDFLFLLNGLPCMVIEAKNKLSKIDAAIAQAIQYAELINENATYTIKVAVGVAGQEDTGYAVVVRFLTATGWQVLESNGYEITNIPSKNEVLLALQADDATTTVSVPSSSEFIDAAIELSRILRLSKIEAPLRPKVIGAIVLAMYQNEIALDKKITLANINQLANSTLKESIDLNKKKKTKLQELLKLTGGDFARLEPHIVRVIAILKRLNIRAVLQMPVDFLGLFYEAFLRYGYDNNALGIVFTPRHITKFCVDLTGISVQDRVIDVASGTGGFLVAAFDKMLENAKGDKAIQKVKQSLYGFDTNPTVWALATLNMFFRGDGKSHIENQSCFTKELEEKIFGQFTRAYLNPPFSQAGEPERDFINLSINCLEPEGLLAVVVKAGIFADAANAAWRKELTRNHSILGVISLPEDLFYPTAAPSSILILQAHIPQNPLSTVFMARIWNDGFEKSKGKRIPISGSQLPIILDAFQQFLANKQIISPLVSYIKGKQITDGQEFSPQQWLLQAKLTPAQIDQHQEALIYSIYKAVVNLPDLADSVLDNFVEQWSQLPDLVYDKSESVDFFFKVFTPKSIGIKNYLAGNCPFVSSGDSMNSIVGLVHEEETEVIQTGGISVTAFGQAYLQPWKFMARGNGGSAVRVLLPKYRMTLNEMLWFAAQINSQKWRFFYGRMAIKSRISKLSISSPSKKITDAGDNLATRVRKFRSELVKLSQLK